MTSIDFYFNAADRLQLLEQRIGLQKRVDPLLPRQVDRGRNCPHLLYFPRKSQPPLDAVLRLPGAAAQAADHEGHHQNKATAQTPVNAPQGAQK